MVFQAPSPHSAAIVPVAKSDTREMRYTLAALFVTVSGNVKYKNLVGATATVSVSVGMWYPGDGIRQVWSTNTTATVAHGLWFDPAQTSAVTTFDPWTDLTKWGTNGFAKSSLPTSIQNGTIKRYPGAVYRFENPLSLLPSGWQTSTVYAHVDPNIGNDSWTGTELDPLRSLDQAYRNLRSITTGIRVITVADNAVFDYRVGTGSTSIENANPLYSRKTSISSLDVMANSNPLVIMPISAYYNGGLSEATWTNSQELTIDWSGVYGVPRGSHTFNWGSASSGGIFDRSSMIRGLPKRFEQVTGTPGTDQYKWDSANNRFEVSSGTNTKHLIAFANYINFSVKAYAGEVHLVNGIIRGGQETCKIVGAVSLKPSLFAYNTVFELGSGASSGLRLEALTFSGLFDCLVRGSGQDGIAYYDRFPFYESGVESHDNGTYSFSTNLGKDQGTTVHNCDGIRLSPNDHHNGGPNVQDTSYANGSCKTLMLGGFAHDSSNATGATRGQTDIYPGADDSSSSVACDVFVYESHFTDPEIVASASDTAWHLRSTAGTTLYTDLTVSASGPAAYAELYPQPVKIWTGADVTTVVKLP